MRIALAGNPNSGKTTMFNALTGRNERVGNWAGVTVEKKEHPVKPHFCPGKEECIAVDLPGAYSMSPFTSEESITRDYVMHEKPDVIINIVDGTNLSRSLFFTTQLLEMGIPTVIAVNKADMNEKKETLIDTGALSRLMGCPVIATVSTQHKGLHQLMEAAAGLKDHGHQHAPFRQETTALSDKAAVKEADKKRYAFVNSVVFQVESRRQQQGKTFQDKMDDVLTHPLAGLVIFAAVMFGVFNLSQATLGPWLADVLAGWIESFQNWVAGLIENASPLLQSLLVDGIIGGVGAVVGFLPLVMVMYFLIALLEDCGYMARVSVVLDPIFKRVGLSGKSVIPFVIGTGCSIPGIMACRTIRNERERRAAAMLTPFMPCGAKLPVIALFAGVFFADAAWVGTAMYFMGILLIFLGALAVNRIAGRRGQKAFFIMELPEYKIPSLKRAVLSMCSRGWAYVVKAGTVILLCNTAVQLMQSFNWQFQLVEADMAHTSILASIARPFSFLLIPLGFGMWQFAAAAITGFIAKENVVGTLAVCFGVTSFIDPEELALIHGAGEVAAVFGITRAAALACLMFNLFTPPCFAAIGAMNSEIKDKKWMLGGVGLQLAIGYSIAFIVYQAGTLLESDAVGRGFLPGFMAVMIFAAAIYLMIKHADNKVNIKKAAGQNRAA